MPDIHLNFALSRLADVTDDESRKRRGKEDHYCSRDDIAMTGSYFRPLCQCHTNNRDLDLTGRGRRLTITAVIFRYFK
jgi:hypothetical protein